MQDRTELLKLTNADEEKMNASCITDWLSPEFFETEFWYMGIDRKILPITPHDKSLRVQREALIKAFR